MIDPTPLTTVANRGLLEDRDRTRQGDRDRKGGGGTVYLGHRRLLGRLGTPWSPRRRSYRIQQ